MLVSQYIPFAMRLIQSVYDRTFSASVQHINDFDGFDAAMNVEKVFFFLVIRGRI